MMEEHSAHESNQPRTSETGFLRFRRLAEMLGDIYFEWDCESDILEWSHDLPSTFLGYTDAACPLKHMQDVLALTVEADREALSIALAELRQGRHAQTDMRLKRADGEEGALFMVAGPFEDPSPAETGWRVCGVMRNRQRLKGVLDSLHEARRMETVGNMASGIAHEFNNHLTPISGYIELALDDLGQKHPLSEGLNVALDRVNYCSELVSQIQAYGQQSILIPTPLNLKVLLPATVRLALSFFPNVAGRIAVREDLAEDIQEIVADQGPFQQALLHIFRNALEAMPEGGTLSVVAENAPDHFVRIAIIDTGVGIPIEVRAHIFDPFFTTRSRAEARGMGLPMAQGMVTQHGGRIEVESQEQQGTTISLYLPAHAVESAALSTHAGDEDDTMQIEAAASPDRVLIADDEALIRQLLRQVFEVEGWEVEEAMDHDDVIAHVRGAEHPYALIIMDLTMPGVSVEESIRHISQTDPDARVLMISGYHQFDDRVQALVQQVNGAFLRKPFSTKDLVFKVDELLAGHS